MPIMSQQEWKNGTYSFWKKRSPQLIVLDEALNNYKQGPTWNNFDAFVGAFSRWAGIKEDKYWWRKRNSTRKFLSSRNYRVDGGRIVDLLWQQICEESTKYRQTFDLDVNSKDYEPGVYIEENIIGYTGDPARFPTVYFSHPPVTSLVIFAQLTASPKQFVRYGHITQCHEKKTNVGRGIVKECCDYRISNVLIDGAMHLQEFIIGRSARTDTKTGSREFHTSRNEFMPVHAGVIADLKMAIEKYRFLKNYDATRRGLGPQPETNLVQDAVTKEWHFG